MQPGELADYADGRPPTARPCGRLIGEAEILVFVYPTWWSGLPAILKDGSTGYSSLASPSTSTPPGRCAPTCVAHRRRQQYGSPWSYVSSLPTAVVGCQGAAAVLHPATPWRWMGLTMENKGLEDRKAFLDRVGHQLRNIG